ncbi:MAG: adenylate kinase [Gammaproteobacteria bacterium]|nr:adenylate kinase [Gammaproteobacteria bacterium]
MRIVLLGAPGSGKGTQGQRLMQHLRIPQISTGDLLREAVARETELGRRAQADMHAGRLVADEIVIEMIHQRLAQPDTTAGFILDGFPRTRPQAAALDVLLEKIRQPLDKVVNLDVPDAEIISRLLARGRVDDTEATIRKRLEVYAQQTRPLLDYYRAEGKLAIVPGVGLVNEIFDRIIAAL